MKFVASAVGVAIVENALGKNLIAARNERQPFHGKILLDTIFHSWWLGVLIQRTSFRLDKRMHMYRIG